MNPTGHNPSSSAGSGSPPKIPPRKQHAPPPSTEVLSKSVENVKKASPKENIRQQIPPSDTQENKNFVELAKNKVLQAKKTEVPQILEDEPDLQKIHSEKTESTAPQLPGRRSDEEKAINNLVKFLIPIFGSIHIFNTEIKENQQWKDNLTFQVNKLTLPQLDELLNIPPANFIKIGCDKEVILELREIVGARIRALETKSVADHNPLYLTESLNILLERKINHKEFNSLADAIKNDPFWKSKVSLQLKSLPPETLIQFISTSPIDFRGYDREVLSVVCSALKKQLEHGYPPEMLKKLNLLSATFTTKIINVPDKDLKALNKGAINIVYKVNYWDNNNKETEGVFKPDASDLPANKLLQEEWFGTSVASGIPAGIDAHLSSRAVASSVVDKLLYSGKQISVNTEFVIINGQRGILMDLAQGKSPKFIDEVKNRLPPNEMKIRIPKTIPKELQSKWVEVKSNCRKIEFIDGVPYATRPQFENFDMNNPLTIAGLTKLQIKDIITGECDRHPENYYVNSLGHVLGIDEDCCFGINAIPKDADVRKQDSLFFIVPNRGSLMLRMPPVVTREMQADILKLADLNLTELQKSIAPYVSAEEIQEMTIRLQKLKEHVTNPEKCLVVGSNEALLQDEAQGRMDTNNSYYKREVQLLSVKEKGWNRFREHRDI